MKVSFQFLRSKIASLLWFVMLVTGLTVIQSVARLSRSSENATERNDAVFSKDVLPDHLQEWNLTAFRPGVQKSGANISWNTHEWQYSRGLLAFTVAFDQLGLHEWHELTCCYEGQGWRLSDRRIVVPGESPAWNCAAAVMTNSEGQHCLVVYSAFWGDGRSLQPPEDRYQWSWTGSNVQPKSELPNRLASRLKATDATPVVRMGLENRALQCQLFFVSADAPEKDVVEELIGLHVQTRETLRKAWMVYATPQDERTPERRQVVR